MVDRSGGVFASCSRRSNCPLASAMDGRICAAAPLTLADQLQVDEEKKGVDSRDKVKHNERNDR